MIPAPLAFPPWQYFSKLYFIWIDAKTYDRKDALLKCGYSIRPTPTQETQTND